MKFDHCITLVFNINYIIKNYKIDNYIFLIQFNYISDL